MRIWDLSHSHIGTAKTQASLHNCTVSPKLLLLAHKVESTTGLQIYGGPGSFSHDFKIRPITFQGSGPTGPILFSCEKSHFNKNIHRTASLQTPQNRKYMKVVNTVKHVLSIGSQSKKTKQRSQ